MPEEVRTCSKCAVTKPIVEFSVQTARDGKRSTCRKCRDCRNTAFHAYYEKNKAKLREASRIASAEFRAKNPELARSRSYASRDKRKKNRPEEYARAAYRSFVRRRYGIKLEDYDRMFAEQNGRCAVCGVANNGKFRFFAVDHNHTTNAVRKLLCNHCNSAIGYLREDPAIARAAAEYLESFTARR
jgi:hypothetical protein